MYETWLSNANCTGKGEGCTFDWKGEGLVGVGSNPGRSFIFLAGLQSNSGLWIDDVRLSVRPSVNILVNLCV